MMLKVLMLVTIVLLVALVVGTPQVLAQYDTYYNPEKRFSIDYLQPIGSNSTTPIDITETENKTKFSDNIRMYITFTLNPRTMDLDEQAISTQKFFQELGYELLETIHPVIIDGKEAFAFSTWNPNFDSASVLVYADHTDLKYVFQLDTNIEYYTKNPDFFEHILNSIRFFD